MKSVRSIIPPYILHRIINNGSDEQRYCAQRTLMHVQSLMVEPATPYPDHEERLGGKPQRTILNAGNQSLQPPTGTLIRAEGQSGNGDIAVEEAYNHLGATYDFFWQVFGRNSLDNKGLALKGIVHYGKNYQNAFWDGRQMVFGDGDGEIFNRFTIAVDIVGHELVHGLIDHETSLIYSRQSGALNESLSDIFGSMIKQFQLKQTVQQADWIIGAGLFTEDIDGKGLRSLARPGTAYDDLLIGTDPQPAHMRDFVNTREDNGGVHLNAGIPNRAFYLVAMALGGHSWEKAGQIWYAAMCDSNLPANADFSIFAKLTVEHAEQLFNKVVADIILQAWHQVGVDTGILNEHDYYDKLEKQ
ncbi:M4 family metallopeptidase [Musicola keenii]|uniref:M4 family metallopeptidase n=1 Tax=Musicola keenii TaxID=2884250 RepID=UPI00177D5841|nr:M4 family metallopeptidase [Musicola keenii]